jgi:hypothetical protein
VISFEIRKCETSSFVLLFKDCFVYSESLEIPCEFQVEFFYIAAKITIRFLIETSSDQKTALSSF